MEPLSERLTVFYSNPNHAACLLVCLIVSSWLIFFRKPNWNWLGVSISLVLFLPLFLTASRGAIVALGIAYGVCFFGRAGVSWKIRWSMLVGAVLMFGVSLLLSYDADRIFTTLDPNDASSQRRLEVWSHVPAMIQAAPFGWGIGNASEAYEQWFQPLEDPVQLKHLLSSHFTWLVEFGWLGRLGYLSLWVAIFWVCCPGSLKSWLRVPLAIWIAFAVMAAFNAVGERWTLWGIPIFWLMMALVFRKERLLPVVYPVAGSILVGIAFGLSVFLFPKSIAGEVYFDRQTVRLGQGVVRYVFVEPKIRILGEFYGHTIRQRISGQKVDGAINLVYRTGWSESLQNKSSQATFVCHSMEKGGWIHQMFAPERIIVLNPTDWDSSVTKTQSSFDGEVYLGAFRLGSEQRPMEAKHLRVAKGSKWYLDQWENWVFR
ncbi:MAG: O-antigen ligase family protein [Verrucomicrobiota bacterium]